MTKSDDKRETSFLYSNFLKHHQDFLEHYNHCNEIKSRMQTSLDLELKTALFEEAMQAHIKAGQAYKKALEALQALRQKILLELSEGLD